ncbi:iron complex transport system substrate-binding protein [Marinomonas alcarazii]|uniref:Iron complex transport system substrate-binding protein n=1 Tax=Marinomonas alcarazii TaxID=491949 RepID=A0A318V6B4_9GAMM|nr:ABC transporter substrate-binding protein [Marinomonas alcarazii]PYF83207.1 iron complex transport system substrate-binding protein [Marinomonas alcarazii]
MTKLKQILAIGTLVAFSQLSTAETRLPTAAVFDLGSLDTMAELGLESQVTGVPQQMIPEYLQQFNSASYSDIGGLKSPDLTALSTLNPDLIIITGRQAGKKDELIKISAVKQVNMSGDNYWHALSDNVNSIATLFHVQDRADKALTDLKGYIESTKKPLNKDATVLVVTHNSGSLGLREDVISSQLLGLKAASIPSHVKSHKRGTRTFTPLTISDIAETNPTVLFVVDRSMAIGNTDEALDVNTLKADLAEQGAGSIKVTYLSPKLWYLSGNGLQSVRMQIKEIAEGL